MSDHKQANAWEKGSGNHLFKDVKIVFVKDKKIMLQGTDSKVRGSIGLNPMTSAKVKNIRDFSDAITVMNQEITDFRIRLFQIPELRMMHRYPNDPGALENLLLLAAKERRTAVNEFIATREKVKDASLAMDKIKKLHEEIQASSKALVQNARWKLRLLEVEYVHEMTEINRDSKLHALQGKTQPDIKQKQLRLRNHKEELLRKLANCVEVNDNLKALEEINELRMVVNNAVENVRCLEAILKILKSHSMQCKEAIRKYEASMIQILRENSGILEVIEIESGKMERTLAYLRKENAVLWTKNEDLIAGLKQVHEQLCIEISDLSKNELQMRQQSQAFQRTQMSLTMDIDTTARLLKRIKDYENIYHQLMQENQSTKRGNRFFQTAIEKLLKTQTAQKDKSNCFPINETLIRNQDRGDQNNELIHGSNKHRQLAEGCEVGVAYFDESRRRAKHKDLPIGYGTREERDDYMDKREEVVDRRKNDDREIRKECTHERKRSKTMFFKLAKRAFCRNFFGKLLDTEEESSQEYMHLQNLNQPRKWASHENDESFTTSESYGHEVVYRYTCTERSDKLTSITHKYNSEDNAQESGDDRDAIDKHGDRINELRGWTSQPQPEQNIPKHRKREKYLKELEESDVSIAVGCDKEGTYYGQTECNRKYFDSREERLYFLDNHYESDYVIDDHFACGWCKPLIEERTKGEK